jgi:ACS family allantoate permease-like MFS transporter
MSNLDDKTDRSSADAEKGMDLAPKETMREGDIVILKHADPNDADEAMKAFIGHEGETIVMTPEMERKLLRKIDFNLMPVCEILSN